MSRIRADKFVNNAATGAPQLTFGAEVVAGVGLTGAGFVNVSGASTVGVLSATSVNATGIITASSFTGTVASSNLSGALPALDGSALTNLNIPAGFTELDAALFN